jgi:hypothetical protein
MIEAPVLQQDYEHWLERLSATHDAVVYTCSYRLAHPADAAQVGVQVIGGLLARPGVFRYSGLPYSGAIARLAEARITAARDGRLPRACSWPTLLGTLSNVPQAHREVLVLTCVHGHDDEQIAALLHCTPPQAAERREATRTFFRGLAAAALPPADHLPADEP